VLQNVSAGSCPTPVWSTFLVALLLLLLGAGAGAAVCGIAGVISELTIPLRFYIDMAT